MGVKGEFIRQIPEIIYKTSKLDQDEIHNESIANGIESCHY